jgi:multicomponent K+:H+ antiporter subunit G
VQREALSLHELLIVLFLLLSAPVSAYMLAKAGRHLGVATRSAPDGPTPAPTERSDPRQS